MRVKVSMSSNIDDAVEKIRSDRDPDFIVVFLPVDSELDSIASKLRFAFPNSVILGATSGAGTFTNENFSFDDIVLGAVFGEDDLRVQGFLIPNLSSGAEELVKSEFSGIFPQEEPDRFRNYTLLVLADAFSISGDDLVDLIRKYAGFQSTVAGGLAGDNWRFRETYVIFGDKVYKDAMVGVVLRSKKRIGVGVMHGWKAISDMMTITKSEDNILYEIDGKPALDVWEEVLKESLGISLDRENPIPEIAKFELGLDYVATREKFIIRAPLSIRSDGGIVFAGKVPTGRKCAIMGMDEDSLIEGAMGSVSEAVSRCGGEPAGAFIFSCAARFQNMGEDYVDEIRAIDRVLSKRPFCGFNTYGEIARGTGELVGFHNTTVVSVVFPK